MCDSDKPDVLSEEVFVGVHVEVSVAVDGHHMNLEALVALQQLPGHDVAVMLHDGEYNLVAGV